MEVEFFFPWESNYSKYDWMIFKPCGSFTEDIDHDIPWTLNMIYDIIYVIYMFNNI